MTTKRKEMICLKKILCTAFCTAALFYAMCAFCTAADLSQTDLSPTDLSSADLFQADLSPADSPYCGEGLYWELKSDGTLIIEGTGSMTYAPWGDYKEKIITLSIGEGAESIAEAAFENCINLKTLILPYTMSAIGANAFGGCTALDEVYYPGTGKTYLLMDIGEGNEAIVKAENFIFTYDYEAYTAEDAYWECAALYPEFINNIKAKDNSGTVDDAALIAFVGNVYDYIKKIEATLDKGEFDSVVFDAVNYAFSLRRNIFVRNAVSSAYPNAAAEAMEGIISDDLRPIYLAVRRAVFEHEMIRFTAGVRYVEIELGNKSATVKFQTKNIDLKEGNIIVAAVYDKASTMRAAFIGGLDTRQKNQAVSIQYEDKSDYIKLFVLEGIGSMKPLGETETVSLKAN